MSTDWRPLYDAARFARTSARQQRAFRWEPQDRIPLGIHVVDPAHTTGISYDSWLDPAPFFEAQSRILCDTLAVPSDVLPIMAVNHLGDAMLTSMFGAEQFMPESAGGQLADVGPTPLPVFDSIAAVAELSMPDADAGIVPAVKRILTYYRERLPEWVHVISPMPAGPFSTALELRGSDLLLELLEEPEPCRRLIGMCAELQARVEMDLRRLTGPDADRFVTSFGVRGAGVRLGEDSMVNLSPELIRTFCLPAFREVNRRCGGRGHIHFCSLPHSRFEFIYPVLTEAADVAVVSSQFGFEYYEQHLDALRGRLAVECFYGDAVADIASRPGGFRDWAFDFVPRFKNSSGLVMYCWVESVAEAQMLWETWDAAHRR